MRFIEMIMLRYLRMKKLMDPEIISTVVGWNKISGRKFVYRVKK